MSAGSSEAVATWSQRCLCSLVDHIFRGYYASDLEVLLKLLLMRSVSSSVSFTYSLVHIHTRPSNQLLPLLKTSEF